MSDLLSGLEKFGFDDVDMGNLFEDGSKPKVSENATPEEKAAAAPKEEDFLLEKGTRCPVCDGVFKALQVKSARIKRLEPDLDLRPRYQDIDTIKYNVLSCPKCGYTAHSRDFDHLSSVQVKLIKDNICTKYKPTPVTDDGAIHGYDYDTAIERYKLALFNTLAKKGKTSEKAYECLNLAWLYRGKKEELVAKNPSMDEATKAQLADAVKNEQAFYAQAFDGMNKAIASENFPICGMDETTVDFLIAAMAYNLKKYDFASRFISSILVSRTANDRIKGKARDMKEKIIEAIKQGQ